MILEKIPYSLNPYILFHGVKNDLDYLWLIFCLEYLTLALEQNTQTVKRKYLEWFHAYNSVHHQEKLLNMQVPDKTVKYPWKNQS